MNHPNSQRLIAPSGTKNLAFDQKQTTSTYTVPKYTAPTYTALTNNSFSRGSCFSKQASNETVQYLSASHVLRPQAEDFIKGIFQQHHNAQIRCFLPELFATFDECGNTKSVLGLRYAECELLYLERYLDQPIETLIEQMVHQSVRRTQVVEIGNLASLNSASCKALFSFITQHLQEQKIKWITCTGTSVLRLVFRRLGIKALSVHQADQNRLGDEQYEWGSYYDNDPQVMLINVQETNQHFIDVAKARGLANSH